MPTSYHEGHFKLLNEDVHSPQNDHCREPWGGPVIKEMEDKLLCVIGIKPKTDIWKFWLKEPTKFELDINPLDMTRVPTMDADSAEEKRPHRSYIGIAG